MEGWRCETEAITSLWTLFGFFHSSSIHHHLYLLPHRYGWWMYDIRKNSVGICYILVLSTFLSSFPPPPSSRSLSLVSLDVGGGLDADAVLLRCAKEKELHKGPIFRVKVFFLAHRPLATYLFPLFSRWVFWCLRALLPPLPFLFLGGFCIFEICVSMVRLIRLYAGCCVAY